MAWNTTKTDNQVSDTLRDLENARKGVSYLAQLPEWTGSVKLFRQIANFVNRIPEETRWHVWLDQVVRAAVSISGNVAEGTGRSSEAQVLQYYRVARGSAWETYTYLLAPPPGIEVPEDLTKMAFKVCQDIDKTIERVCLKRLKLLGVEVD